MNKLNIIPIQKEYVTEISEYCFNEWDQECKTININSISDYESDMLNNYFIENNTSDNISDNNFTPVCLIALLDKELVGSIELIKDDLPNYNEYNPWIASLYVKPTYRKKNIGKQLVQKLIKKAQTQNIKNLYLWTKNQHIQFYEKLGWKSIEQLYYCDNLINIMILSI